MSKTQRTPVFTRRLTNYILGVKQDEDVSRISPYAPSSFSHVADAPIQSNASLLLSALGIALYRSVGYMAKDEGRLGENIV